jgi:hypothetical protein
MKFISVNIRTIIIQIPYNTSAPLLVNYLPGCDYCPQWYHPRCLGLSEEETIQVLNLSTWRCPECLKIQGNAASDQPAGEKRSSTLSSPHAVPVPVVADSKEEGAAPPVIKKRR